MSSAIRLPDICIEGFRRITFPIPKFRREESGPRLPMDDADVVREFTELRVGAQELHHPSFNFPQLKDNGHFILDGTNNVWLGFEDRDSDRFGILTWRHEGQLPASIAMVVLFFDRHGYGTSHPSDFLVAA